MANFADTAVNVINGAVDIRKDVISIKDDIKNREFSDIRDDGKALFGDVKEFKDTVKEIKQSEINPLVKERLDDIKENGVTKQDLAVLFTGAAVMCGAEAGKEDPVGTARAFGSAVIDAGKEFGSFLWDNTVGRLF